MRTIKVAEQGLNNTIVEVRDEDGLLIDDIEEVEDVDVESAIEQLKQSCYFVQDYIREAPISFQWTLIDRTERTTGHYRRFTYTFTCTRGNYSYTSEFETGGGDCSKEEVLECLFDDAMSVRAYGEEQGNLEAFADWANDLGYDESNDHRFGYNSRADTKISNAVKAWKDCWEAYDAIQQFFTEEERENITHVFEEGRRS